MPARPLVLGRGRVPRGVCETGPGAGPRTGGELWRTLEGLACVSPSYRHGERPAGPGSEGRTVEAVTSPERDGETVDGAGETGAGTVALCVRSPDPGPAGATHPHRWRLGTPSTRISLKPGCPGGDRIEKRQVRRPARSHRSGPSRRRAQADLAVDHGRSGSTGSVAAPLLRMRSPSSQQGLEAPASGSTPMRGCGVATDVRTHLRPHYWSILRALGARDPDSNSGSPIPAESAAAPQSSG